MFTASQFRGCLLHSLLSTLVECSTGAHCSAARRRLPAETGRGRNAGTCAIRRGGVEQRAPSRWVRFEPGGCTAFRSDSNINMLTRPARFWARDRHVGSRGIVGLRGEAALRGRCVARHSNSWDASCCCCCHPLNDVPYLRPGPRVAWATPEHI